MASKAEKAPTPTQEARIPTEAQFLKIVKQLRATEAELSEIKGRMGSTVEQGIANHNLHKDALRVFRKYANKSPAQAANFMLHLTTYWEYGMLGEGDLFETEEDKKKLKAAGKKNETLQDTKERLEHEAIEGQGDARTREELESVH